MPTTDLCEEILALTCQLMTRRSVTPDDSGCQALLADRLSRAGFHVEQIDRENVKNLWAVYGSGGPHLMFAGHTDVVPPGQEAQWRSPPFTPTVIDGVLHGRGAADMKSSLAAMVVAVEQVLTANPELAGTLSFLLTSDEEGDAIYGTRHVVDVLNQRAIKPDYCIVGEPSSTKIVGDVVRCGRRGSLNAKLIVHGVQGHVAYPNEALNPIHQALHALTQLTTRQWDNGNRYYPPTSLQISNVNAGTGATNVIPGLLEVQFNLRFSTEQTSDGLQQTIADIFDHHELNYELLWQHSGDPFLTERGDLSRAVLDAIESVQGIEAELSTSGGTSDGRFISPWGKPGSNQVEVIELGPTNATIHKVNECVALAELAPLALIYQRIVENLLTS